MPGSRWGRKRLLIVVSVRGIVNFNEKKKASAGKEILMQKNAARLKKRAFPALIAVMLVFVSALNSGCIISDTLFGHSSSNGGSYFDTESAYSDEPSDGSPPELDFVVADLEEPLEVDTYEDYELLGKRYLHICDSEYLDLFFDYPSVTAEECIAHIDGNHAIPEQYKALMRKYVNSVAAKYPEADLRPFDYNIRTLEIQECDEFELALHTMSIDAYGCYVRTENKIYVPKGYEYKPGTWEYQVIMHELSHVARTVSRTVDKTNLDIDISIECCIIPEEALNSIFTVSLFDYEERDIAYQLQSNMFLVLTDCLEGYELSDYINHSLTYFAHMLDEQNGNTNYAMAVMKLIEEQRSDWSNDDYEREQEFYYPIYDYLTKMYVDKYAEPEMSESELKEMVDRLVDTVMYDVPEDYNIDTAEFYRFAEEYYSGSAN